MKYLAACCTVRNEAPYILEWLAFHRAVGFERLFVVDHESTDGTADIVASFHDAESVTLQRWDGPGAQMDIYNAVVAEHRGAAFWCAFLGADEFLYPADGGDIRQTLSEYEEAGAVGVHWMTYGSSGFEEPQPGLTTEAYVRRAPADFVANGHVRPVVRLRAAGSAITSHFFDTTGPMLDENFLELPNRPPHGFYGERPPSHNRLRINHYHTRSRAEFAAKARRGFFDGPGGPSPEQAAEREAAFPYHDRNEVEDRSALRYSALTRFYTGGREGA